MDRIESVDGFGNTSSDAARKLITKIVNALIAQQQTGGSFLCANLLGQPDHYTNMRFKTFYWYSFVKYVSQLAEGVIAEDLLSTDRVVVGMVRDNVVPITRINDYIFRPSGFETWTLYDYLRKTIAKRMSPGFCLSCIDDVDNSDGKSSIPNDDFVSEDEVEESADTSEAIADNVHPEYHIFLCGHPARSTHAVCMLKSPKILNFVGGSLPRNDKGDLNEYGKTMLTFFSPGGWHDGKDIIHGRCSWKSAFDSTSFAGEHVQIMKHMHVLYECLDARDDYSTIHRALAMEDRGIAVFEDGLAYVLEEELQMQQSTQAADGYIIDLLDIIEGVGTEAAKIQMRMSAMTVMLRRIFVQPRTDCMMTGINEDFTHSFQYQCPAAWKVAVCNARDAVIAVRMRRHSIHHGTDRESSVTPSALHSVRGTDDSGMVKVMSVFDFPSSTTLESYSRPPQDAAVSLLTGVMNYFSLNNEQQRAFVLAARFLHHHENEPLWMYLGGMGGTGKSRVLHSLMFFLVVRDEAYRFLVVAPTGSTASLVDGNMYHSVLGFGR
ncbi:hypothetical protein BKA93DRAFT_723263, partial [Sparassis latifolia]